MLRSVTTWDTTDAKGRCRPILLKNSKLRRRRNSARCEFDRELQLLVAANAADRLSSAMSARPGRPLSLMRCSLPVGAILSRSLAETEFFNRIGQERKFKP